MYPISICIIARNEEKNLGTMLPALRESLSSYPGAYELLLVDTGSTDHTIEIAHRNHCRMVSFPWVQDFSAARNFTLKQASYDRILFLDADEIPEEADWMAMQELLHTYPKEVGRFLRRNKCCSDGGSSIMLDRVERFFDRRYYHYEGKIHEQLTDNSGALLRVYDIPLTVYHEGYYGSPEQLAEKAGRNNALLLEEIKSQPQEPYFYYQLGNSYGLMQETAKQYDYYVKAYALHPQKECAYYPDLVLSLGHSMLALDKKEEALQLFAEGYDDLKSYADFLCFGGLAYTRNGMLTEAIRTYKAAKTAPCIKVEGSNTSVPDYNLGCIYEAFGDEENAISCFQNAVSLSDADKRLAKLREQITPESMYFKKVSVILAIRNEKDNYEEVLKCLQEQTIGLCHLEIIIVCNRDFALPDSLIEFEKMHPNSVLLLYSDTVCDYAGLNTLGLSYASADYICFWTANERAQMDAFRFLRLALLQEEADFACCNVHLEGTEEIEYYVISLTDSATREELLTHRLLGHGAFHKLFNRKFLTAHQLSFLDLEQQKAVWEAASILCSPQPLL